jgi:nucleotide-binding universal stress UspA family protein
MGSPTVLNEPRAMHLLCGVDSSAAGRNAAFAAAHLARRLGGRLTLLRVVAHGVTPVSSRTTTSGVPLNLQVANAVTEAARRELDALADEIARSLALRPEVRVESGNPAARLLAAARESATAVIVIGAIPRSRLGDALFAETRDRLTQHAPCPVVVVPAHAALPTGHGVALAFETPAVSDDAAAVAAQLSRQLDAGTTVIHVLANPRSYPEPVLPMQRAARAAIEGAVPIDDLDIRHATAYRNPAGDLARTIAEIEPAVLVAGATRRPNWRNLLWPSVAAELVRRATHAVVVVPVGATLPAELRTAVAPRRLAS